jgi:bifunctional non-homologous end joining protein LigD
LRSLSERLRDIVVDGCPFDPPPPASVVRTATWVDPILRARVEIAEFTNDGLVRHASFVDLAR